jgi:hypothetical protein
MELNRPSHLQRVFKSHLIGRTCHLPKISGVTAAKAMSFTHLSCKNYVLTLNFHVRAPSLIQLDEEMKVRHVFHLLCKNYAVMPISS